MGKKSIILISVAISVTITLLVIFGIGYYAFRKYVVQETVKNLIVENIFGSFKGKNLKEIITPPIKEFIKSGKLNELLVDKLEQISKMDATIGDITYDEDRGLFLNKIKLFNKDGAVSIKLANLDPTKGLILNGIEKTGKLKADTITIDKAKVGLRSIVLEKLAINPSAEITTKNLRFLADKAVIGIDLIDMLDKKTIVLKDLKLLTFEIFLIKRKNGLWLFMDSLKTVMDKFNLPNDSGMLVNGAVGRSGKIHIIDKEVPEDTLDVSGIDIRFTPNAGDLRDVILKGSMHDEEKGDISLTGKIDLNKPTLDIKVNSDYLKVSKAFLNNVPAIGRKLWDSYKPTGNISIAGDVKFYTVGEKRIFEPSIDITLNDVQMTYKQWPFTATRGKGKLQFLGNIVNISGLEGYVYKYGQEGTKVNFDAIMEIGKPEKKLIISASNVKVTKELVGKLPKVCQNLYSEFKPTGKADMTVTYTVDTKRKSNYIIELDCKKWNLIYPKIPVPLKDINGKVVISSINQSNLIKGASSGSVQLRNMNGYFNDGTHMVPFDFSGEFDTGSDKKLLGINIPSLNINSHVLQYLPEEYENILKDFTLGGKADLKINYDNTNSESDSNLSMTLDCKGCNFADSRFPAPLLSVMGTIEIDENRIYTDHVIGRCYSGEVKGSIDIDIEDDGYKYDGTFNFADMDMQELFEKVFKTDDLWPGILSGKLKFNRGDKNQKGFDASGNIIFKKGSITNVPVALSIFNILNLGLPKKVVFESGYINFFIENNIIKIEEAKLTSDSIELVAQGNVSFKGDLDIMVIVGFSNNVLLEIPVLGKLFEGVVGGVRKKLTKVHVGGTIKEPKSSLAMFSPKSAPIEGVEDLFNKTNSHGTHTANLKPKKFKSKN